MDGTCLGLRDSSSASASFGCLCFFFFFVSERGIGGGEEAIGFGSGSVVWSGEEKRKGEGRWS